ncbi:MAG: DsrE family protein [Candidatus Eisenbacteria bacterium]|uniref:DsrE family protein n=1 Tax=Eiseniibacteriota bacterium TaxID=2212470 RepID=A0A956M4R4_UNCEI|nr:DsrE family protein [Candidatus Eisenbacteria bacterium]
MAGHSDFLVVLTTGREDNGKHATLAFACALSAVASGKRTKVFLTGDGAIWGFKGTAQDIMVQGFPPLESMIRDYQEAGGSLLCCSTCYLLCSNGPPSTDIDPTALRPGAEVAGFPVLIETACNGGSVTF